MASTVRYAAGHKAWGVCGRCGIRALLNTLVFDEYFPHMRVHPNCRDSRHPQEVLTPLSDPQGLWRPAPEPGGPTSPVLSGEIEAVVVDPPPPEEDVPPVLSVGSSDPMNSSLNVLTWEAATFGSGSPVDHYDVYSVEGNPLISDPSSLTRGDMTYLDTVAGNELTYTDQIGTPNTSVQSAYIVVAISQDLEELESNPSEGQAPS